MKTRIYPSTILLALIGAGTLMPTVHAATVSVCDSAELLDDGPVLQQFAANGQLVALTVGDERSTDPDCRTLELPVTAKQVRWLALSDIPLSESPPLSLALQGRFSDESVDVSEVIRNQVLRTEPDFLPFGDNLVPYFERTPFGLEERAFFNDSNELVCADGNQVAGIVLRSTSRWGQLQGMTLELGVSGNGRFEFAIADGVREASGTPRPLGAAILTADKQTLRFALPSNVEPWTALTLVCPPTTAVLDLASLRLLPPPPAPAPANRRATWLWTPALWQSSADLAWNIAKAEGLDKLYITAPVGTDGRVENAAALAAFIRAARDRDIEVWAVVGDRRDVLPASRAALLRRARAYVDYNAAHEEALLGGIQLDIEPYLLPGFALAPAYWRVRYIETVTAVHTELAGKLPLDLVLPVWWGTHPDWGSSLLNALVLPDLSLTIMNYRTVAASLRAGAMPFLAWGQRNRVPVAMALETGSISRDGSSETRRHYGSDTEGELWLLELDGMRMLILLDGSYGNLPGQAYRFASETEFNNSNITFAAAPANLSALASQLEQEWRVWPAFGGLAIHGLEERYTPRQDPQP